MYCCLAVCSLVDLSQKFLRGQISSIIPQNNSMSCYVIAVICRFWVVMFHTFVSLCTSHFLQLTDTLAQTEQKLEDLKLAQARMEANNSARIAAQSAGILLLCILKGLLVVCTCTGFA